MKVRSMLVGAAAVAALALAPSNASAQINCGGATYSASLGIGGALSGCFNFSIFELGENAGGVADQFYWNGNFGGTAGAPNNAPTVAGTQFFNDDCGSSGGITFTTFAFCPVVPPVTGSNAAGEFVLGLRVLPGSDPQGNGNVLTWIYSGLGSRNAFPSPAGFQAVLMQLTTGGASAINPYNGNPATIRDGEFLFAWEDLNSGCTNETPTRLYFRTEDLGSQQALDDGLNHSCITFNPGGTPSADNDYNDSYIRLTIQGQRLDTVTPEPMTMTLMATGLVGLAGAQIRRRKKN